MNTKKTVFSKIAKGMPKKQVKLSLIDDIASEYQRFQDAYDDASFLAYEYADEIIDAYDNFKSQYPIDDFVINGNARDLEEVTEIMQGYFDKLEAQVQDLGIDPESILPSYYDLKQWLSEAPTLNKLAEDKYREVTEYVGLPNFWR
jgi:hypothetical protein